MSEAPQARMLVLDREAEHEVNNHLAVILGFSDLLLADTPPDDPRHADLQEIGRAVRAVIALLRRDDVRR